MPIRDCRIHSGGRVLPENEVAFAPEPFVHANAALHPLCPVVRDQQDESLLEINVLENFADLAVEKHVVILKYVPVGIALLVEAVPGVAESPEAVVEPVRPHFHEHEEVPRLGLEKMPDHPKALLCHLVDLPEKPILVLGPEVLDVDDVPVCDPLHLLLELAGVGVLALVVRGEKTGDQVAPQRFDRIRLGDADEHGVSAVSREDVPEGRLSHGQGVGEGEPVIGIILPVAEAVEAELARILARHHARPGGHGDGGVAASEAAPKAGLHQAPEVREVVEIMLKGELGCEAVQPDDQDPFDRHGQAFRIGRDVLGNPPIGRLSGQSPWLW